MLGLLREGLSNAEIAERQFISAKTAEHASAACPESPQVSLNDLCDRAPRPMADGEVLFRYSSLAPDLPVIVDRLADLEPTTLALMHGSSFSGDGGGMLRDLAEAYDTRFLAHA